MDCVEVPMPCGRKFIVDRSSFDKIKHLTWRSQKHKSGKYYVTGTYYERDESGALRSRQIQLSRFLTGLQRGNPLIADHKNGNPLDNRLANLRVCTARENVHNQTLSKRNTSGFKGVSKCVRKGRQRPWIATIAVNGKTHYLGSFFTPEEAHAAYCAAAERLHREFANFGEDRPDVHDFPEMCLPRSIAFMGQHLPDPIRNVPVDPVGGLMEIPPDWAEWRSPRSNGLLGSDQQIYSRVCNRFSDLVESGVVSVHDRPTAIALLTAAEVGFDVSKTIKASRQKHPVVVQVFKNMREAGLWRECELGKGVRWGFTYGWRPEDEENRKMFAAELADHVKIAREAVAEAEAQWCEGIEAARAVAAEAKRQARLARSENRPYPRTPSRFRPTGKVEAFAPLRASKFRVIVATEPKCRLK